MNICPWIDCLGRLIYIKKSALKDVCILIRKNLNKYNNIDPDYLNENDEYAITMNKVVDDMITTLQTPEEDLSTNKLIWVNVHAVDFFHDDNATILPIQVLSNTSPSNAHNFLIHIILSLGKYDTEIDALTHQSIRKCLQHVALIGENEDEESLKEYSRKLTRRYIEEQLVYFPNSLSHAETFIAMAKRVFDDAIIQYQHPISDINGSVFSAMSLLGLALFSSQVRQPRHRR